MPFVYYNWEEVNINWESVNLNWEEVGILINDVLPFVGILPVTGKRWYDLKNLNKLPEKKKRKILHIVCKIQGTEFEEYKYKNDEDINITVEHINIIIDEILNNIKVNVQNIS